MLQPDRLSERLQAARLSQAELARRIGISQQAVGKLVNGESRTTGHLHRIARELGTTPAYLEGETDDPSEGALPAPTPETIADQLDLVGIAEIDLQYGMGASYVDNPVAEDLRYFPRSFIEAITSSPPSQLTLARPQGDSMEPTIRGGSDFVIIDRSERSVRAQDVIWAFTVGEIGMIKRLRVRGRKVTILSDNPSVDPDEADAEEVNIVGRIIFVGRRL